MTSPTLEAREAARKLIESFPDGWWEDRSVLDGYVERGLSAFAASQVAAAVERCCTYVCPYCRGAGLEAYGPAQRNQRGEWFHGMQFCRAAAIRSRCAATTEAQP